MPESAPTTAERAIDGAAVDDRGLRVALSPYLFRSMLVGMAGVAIGIHRTTGSRTLAWRFAKARARHREWVRRARDRDRSPDRPRVLPRHAPADAARQPARGRARSGRPLHRAADRNRRAPLRGSRGAGVACPRRDLEAPHRLVMARMRAARAEAP